MTDTPPIRTLVVDDDVRIASIHGQFVEKVPGFCLIGTAHSAADALAQIQELRPDLLLLDIYLPDGSGFDLMHRVNAEPSPPAVMIISAARDVSHIRAALTQGAVHYLVKPFRFSAFAERLTAFRDLHQRLEDLDARTVEADQQEVDGLFQLMRTGTITAPPKGLSADTLRVVRDHMRHTDADVSASDLAAEVGISRPTAQRYLSALAQQGVVEVHLRYGATGRPEHRYRATRPSAV